MNRPVHPNEVCRSGDAGWGRVIVTETLLDGSLWLNAGDEYECPIIFCPFCGQRGRIQPAVETAQ